jgi:hypothetical protein
VCCLVMPIVQLVFFGRSAHKPSCIAAALLGDRVGEQVVESTPRGHTQRASAGDFAQWRSCNIRVSMSTHCGAGRPVKLLAEGPVGGLAGLLSAERARVAQLYRQGSLRLPTKGSMAWYAAGRGACRGLAGLLPTGWARMRYG